MDFWLSTPIIKYGYIYKTTNLKNGKIYIGKHKYNPEEPFETYLGSGTILRRALKKYGKENFSKEILRWCSNFEEMCQKERYWVLEH